MAWHLVDVSPRKGGISRGLGPVSVTSVDFAYLTACSFQNLGPEPHRGAQHAVPQAPLALNAGGWAPGFWGAAPTGFRDPFPCEPPVGGQTQAAGV